MNPSEYFKSINVEVDQVKFNGFIFHVLRLDNIHGEAAGNKFFKLKYNVLQAQKEAKKTLLTFGGAFSNHIHATALCASTLGFQSVGVIRGEEVSNSTLEVAKNAEMELFFIDRSTYRNKYSEEFMAELRKKYGDFYLIPEGGTNDLAIQGTREINDLIPPTFKNILTSAGTFGTAAGLISGKKAHQSVIILPSLKGKWFADELAKYVDLKTEFKIMDQYHFGGYAKWDRSLIDFMNAFRKQTNILLDPVYTGKLFFGAYDMFQKGTLMPAETILIHSGGLQGVQGFNQRFGGIIET